MEKICKNCFHWKLPQDGEYFGAHDVAMPINPITFLNIEQEEEQRSLFGYATKYCRCPKLKFYQRPDKDGCCVADGSQYMASLITGQDFGCSNFELEFKPLSTSH